MNRRQFLKRALLGVPVVALAAPLIPEIVEAFEPKRTIFLPPAGGWLGPEEITLGNLSVRAEDEPHWLYGQSQYPVAVARSCRKLTATGAMPLDEAMRIWDANMGAVKPVTIRGVRGVQFRLKCWGVGPHAPYVEDPSKILADVDLDAIVSADAAVQIDGNVGLVCNDVTIDPGVVEI